MATVLPITIKAATIAFLDAHDHLTVAARIDTDWNRASRLGHSWSVVSIWRGFDWSCAQRYGCAPTTVSMVRDHRNAGRFPHALDYACSNLSKISWHRLVAASVPLEDSVFDPCLMLERREYFAYWVKHAPFLDSLTSSVHSHDRDSKYLVHVLMQHGCNFRRLHIRLNGFLNCGLETVLCSGLKLDSCVLSLSSHYLDKCRATAALSHASHVNFDGPRFLEGDKDLVALVKKSLKAVKSMSISDELDLRERDMIESLSSLADGRLPISCIRLPSTSFEAFNLDRQKLLRSALGRILHGPSLTHLEIVFGIVKSESLQSQCWEFAHQLGFTRSMSLKHLRLTGGLITDWDKLMYFLKMLPKLEILEFDRCQLAMNWEHLEPGEVIRCQTCLRRMLEQGDLAAHNVVRIVFVQHEPEPLWYSSIVH
jgi:hypothetical protein